MASSPGPFSTWPWEKLGSFKYTLLVPFAISAVTGRSIFGTPEKDDWSLHMLVIVFLRYIHNQVWISISRCHALTAKYQISSKGINFNQVDREDHWDDYIILHLFVSTAVHEILPGFHSFPLSHNWGLLILLLVHMGPTESIYYWAHRALHHHWLYTRYHSHHHASFVTEPITGSVHPFAEHIMYTAIFAVPMIGTWLLGGASIVMFYVYFLGFDFLNNIGHCNFEFMPRWLFKAFPPLKYLIYTPSYHSLHHSQVHTNFCLFMPLYDYMGGTMDPQSERLHSTARGGRKPKVDFVFLAHGTDILSILHLPFAFRTLSSYAYRHHWYTIVLWPFVVPFMPLLWLFGKTFVASTTRFGQFTLQTWVVPRFGFQYFLPFGKKQINNLIENAILDADKAGVKVFGLGALNKNEALNGGGVVFTKKHEDLKVRVVHGNTLTAAALIHQLPQGVKAVFLAGGSSKLGRAIALYLCKRNVHVAVLTQSKDRFRSMRSELPEKYAQYMIQAETCKDGSTYKHWVVARWLSSEEQKFAPPGAHFYQLAVPPIAELRKDCTYGALIGMRLPKGIENLRTCEMTMERGVVHGCHAGALVHLLEGWDHHEVGAIDPERIDVTWEAAMRLGFQLA